MEEFEIIYRFWFYLFQFGTALGGEFFLSLMFPCWFWNIDGAVGRRMAVIWSLSMYIGNFPESSYRNDNFTITNKEP